MYAMRIYEGEGPGGRCPPLGLAGCVSGSVSGNRCGCLRFFAVIRRNDRRLDSGKIRVFLDGDLFYKKAEVKDSAPLDSVNWLYTTDLYQIGEVGQICIF